MQNPRRLGDTGWTTITTSTTPVINGVLGVWNTPATEGYYYIRLTARNAAGLTAFDEVVVYVNKVFDTVDLRSPVNGGIYGGVVCFDGTVFNNICGGSYTVDYRPAGGNTWFPVDPSNPVYNNWVINDPLASWNTISLGLADGNYNVRVVATDVCNDSRTVTRTVTIDNTAPTAVITSPTSCSVVNGVVTIRGTASDANLSGWVLQYTGGNANGWVTIASGSSSIVNGVLAHWNTAGLRSCAYTLRLLVSDRAVVKCGPWTHQSEYLISVVVGIPGDVNLDGCVNDADLTEVLLNFGRGC